MHCPNSVLASAFDGIIRDWSTSTILQFHFLFHQGLKYFHHFAISLSLFILLGIEVLPPFWKDDQAIVTFHLIRNWSTSNHLKYHFQFWFYQRSKSLHQYHSAIKNKHLSLFTFTFHLIRNWSTSNISQFNFHFSFDQGLRYLHHSTTWSK